MPQIWRSRSGYKSIAVSFCDQLVCSRLLATPAHPSAWLQRRIVSFLSGSSRLLSGSWYIFTLLIKACRVAPPQNLVLSQDFRRDFLFTNKLTSRHTGETETRGCVCLLLQDLLQSCSRGGEEESGRCAERGETRWSFQGVSGLLS